MTLSGASAPSSELKSAYDVGVAKYLLVGCCCVTVFGACIAGAVLSHQYLAVVLFVPLLALSTIPILTSGHYSITERGVTHRSPVGSFHIDWTSVLRVEQGNPDGTLVLHGKDQRLVLAAPSYWSGSETLEALEFLWARIDDLGLAVTEGSFAAYKLHRNVRVHPSSSAGARD